MYDAPIAERINRPYIVATSENGHEFWQSVKEPIIAAAKREADSDAYERGLNARQGECEWWGIAGLVLGALYMGGIWFFSAW